MILMMVYFGIFRRWKRTAKYIQIKSERNMI